MTWALIAVTTTVYVIEVSLHRQHLEQIAYLFGIVPARFTHVAWAASVGFPVDNYWPFLTSIFLHTGTLHLAGNMWFLWIFGDNVEDRMGRWRFLIFYLICGIVAGIVHVGLNRHSTVPALGASGAIAGVLGGYVLLFPRARIETLFLLVFFPFFFELPAYFYLLYWFGIQLLSGTARLLGPAQMGGVAFWAHVGGFVAGISLCRLFVAKLAPASASAGFQNISMSGS